MSGADDRRDYIESVLDSARLRSLYGKRYSQAYQLAERIKLLRSLPSLAQRHKLELNEWVREYSAQTAEIVLAAAITSSGKLRELADALDAEKGLDLDERQTDILAAYTECVANGYIPTLAELRAVFVQRFSKSWTSDFGARKTLGILGLPLSKDKLGRPFGSKSLIRNPKH